MSDVAPASPKPAEAGHHDFRDGPKKQLQVPQAASDLQASLQPSTIGQINGSANHSNGDANAEKSDSEAETVVLSGKEEGQDHTSRKAIKLEEAIGRGPYADRQLKDTPVIQEEQQEASGDDGVRQPSLKRKRAMPDHGHGGCPGSGNSSNLSSTVSSPAPQANSSKTTDSASDRSRSSPPLDEVVDGQERRASRASTEKGNIHGYRRGGRSDRASEPVTARKRRDTRSATHHEEPSHRSESPPSLNNSRASIQSKHPYSAYSGVTKRRKVPAPLHVESRRKASEDTHAESDDDSSVHSHRYLHKFASADNTAMSPAQMVSEKRNRDRSGQTLLAKACRSGDVFEVGRWLQERPQDLNVPDYAENTPLQIAALVGNTEVVQLLLDVGCDIDCRNIEKDTPLIDAVENGHLEVVALLLRAGLDPRQPNAKGQEPLDLVNPDHDDAEEIRGGLQASKKEKVLLRRPSEDHNRQQGTGSRDVDVTSGAAFGASPIISSRSPPPMGPTAKRRTARSQATDESLLWVNPTPDRLRDAAGKGDGKIVEHILKMNLQADTGSILAAARGGHEDVLNLMLAIGMPDPDPEPLTLGEYKPAASTPMLAAIGRGKISIIELLLQQAGFDPTRRRYKAMTYYEIAKERQGADWQEEHDLLKTAYDSYRQHGGRKSYNNSPRRMRAKRADSTKSVSEPSSSPHEARKTRKSSTLREESSNGGKRDSAYKSAALKYPGETKKQISPALALDHESRPIRPPKAKTKDSNTRSEKGHLTSKRADTLKPKRRLMSGNEYKGDQDMKRRASLAADIDVPRASLGDPISSHDDRQRRISDTSQCMAVDTSEEASNVRSESGKKRHRMSVCSQASTSDLGGNIDPEKKKRQRADSQGNAVDQERDRSFRPGHPAMVANMIASLPGQAPPTVSQGTAPVAYMGSNVASPLIKSPRDLHSHSAITSPGNSIDQAPSQQPHQEELRAPRQVDERTVEQETMGQELGDQAIEAEERALREENEKRRQIEVEQERTVQAKKEEAERKALLARQEEEEAHLENQRQAADAERRIRIEQEQEEARVSKMKRDEELHQRRMEQERLRKEEQERRRREMEERENLRRMRLQEEEERQRLQSLPNGLRRAAELAAEEARITKEITKWLPLCTVETQELDPECEPMIAEERWVANIQVAPILAIKDLDLSQCEYQSVNLL